MWYSPGFQRVVMMCHVISSVGQLPPMSGVDRVVLIQDRLKEVQKHWTDLKAEVAYIERKRRRARRKEREGMHYPANGGGGGGSWGGLGASACSFSLAAVSASLDQLSQNWQEFIYAIWL